MPSQVCGVERAETSPPHRSPGSHRFRGPWRSTFRSPSRQCISNRTNSPWYVQLSCCLFNSTSLLSEVLLQSNASMLLALSGWSGPLASPHCDASPTRMKTKRRDTYNIQRLINRFGDGLTYYNVDLYMYDQCECLMQPSDQSLPFAEASLPSSQLSFWAAALSSVRV